MDKQTTQLVEALASRAYMYSTVRKSDLTVTAVKHAEIPLADYTGFITVGSQGDSTVRVNYILDCENLGGLDISKTVNGSGESVQFNKSYLARQVSEWVEREGGLLAPADHLKTLTAQEQKELADAQAILAKYGRK